MTDVQRQVARLLYLAVALLLCAMPVSAQPIHQHPQKISYASPAEWPPISFQCHWAPGEAVNPSGSVHPFMAHTHIEGKWPLYAELSQPVTIPFKVVLFHTDGFVDVVTSGPGVPPHIIWDATGTSEMPPMIGDPNGVKEWTGRATFDPKEGAEGRDLPKPRGWWYLTIMARTIYNKPTSIPGFKVAMGQMVIIPYYSMIDPSARERATGDGEGELRSNCGVNADDPGGFSIFGSNSSIIRRQDAPLLAPFNAPWPADIAVYGYGIAPGFPPGFYRVFVDPDLHNGHEGRKIRDAKRLFNFEDYQPFNPAEIGLGKHKLAIDWVQSGDGAPQLFNPGETLVSRLVVEVEVTDGPVIPPPPPPDPVPPASPPPPVPDVCPDIQGVQLTVPVGMVLVNGQCVTPPPPPPPPPPAWLPAGTYRLCAAAGKCVELVVK